MKVIVVNGPNLNLLGQRQPEIYGHKSFEDYLNHLKEIFPEIELYYFQSNIEGELIDTIQAAGQSKDAIVLNAGGYSHTSVALADAVAAISIPTVTVHISNIYQREPERHKELLAKVAAGGIYGLGLDGYKLAIDYLINQKRA